MKSADPYLNFDGNTEEAFTFYKLVFGSEFRLMVRFKDLGDNEMGVPESQLNKIAHVALPLGGSNILMGTDVVSPHRKALKVGNNFYVMLEMDSVAEAQKVFDALSDAGAIEMPLQRTPWAEKYGTLTDKFGVQWMISYTGEVQFGARA